jgi:hypothetical protein
MAAQIPEINTSFDILNGDERRAVEDGRLRQVGETILAYTAIAEHMGVENPAELAGQVREALADLPDSDIKALRKAAQKFAGLMPEMPSDEKVGAQLYISPEIHVAEATKPKSVQTQNILEVTTDLVAPVESTPEITESPLDPVKDPYKFSFSESHTDNFSRLLGKYAPGAEMLKSPLEEDEIVGLLAELGLNVKGREAARRQVTILLSSLEGRTDEAIGEDLGSSKAAVYQTRWAATKRLAGRLLDLGATPTPKVELPSPQLQQTIPTPATVHEVSSAKLSMPEVTKSSLPRLTESELLDMEPHQELSLRFAQVLGLDSALTVALRGLLDEKNNFGQITPNKVRACEIITTAIVERGWPNLQAEELGLEKSESHRLNTLLGLPHGATLTEDTPLGAIQPLQQTLTIARNNGRNPAQEKNLLFRGLRILAKKIEETPPVQSISPAVRTA